MKKLLVLAMVAMLAVNITACGSKNEGGETPAPTEAAAPEETPEETTEEAPEATVEETEQLTVEDTEE